jgi:beta-lactam-binding protein with PASTA domain/predicted Ser/Thr protein kinase
LSLENQLLANRYRIERLLARGGMADVFLATDERLERPVAVKVIHSHLASDPRFTDKFIREAKTAAKLNHPNLVNVFDQGSDGGHTFMVMEYVPGMTLREALDKFGKLSPSRSLDLLEAILQGLAAAHRAGFLHRDLKPENIFLADDGQIKLGDFGLAREASAHTNTGSLLGTIAYIAPELLSRGHADARSDVYSAGIMLYEFVTGRQPFTGTDVAHIAHQHTSVGVPAPSLIAPSVPPLLDELVLWATAMAPEHRPANAQVLVEVVQRVKAELKAGRGATTKLDLPAFSGIEATRVLSVESTTKLSAPSLDTNGTVLIGDDYLAPQAGKIQAGAGQAGAGQAGATEAIGNFGATTIIDPAAPVDTLSPLEELAYRRRRRAPWIALVIAVATLLSSGAGWWFSAGPGGMTTLPNLQGTVLSAALSTVKQYSTDVTVDREYSTNVAKGLVTRTEPATGQEFWRGSHITVFVSKGVQMAPVPALVGMSQQQADQALTAAGFKVGDAGNYFSTQAKGEVFDFTGSDGNPIALGSSVNLKISAGQLPTVVGQLQPLAAANLIAAGAQVGKITFEYTDAVVTGAVSKVKPDSDPLPLGGKVNLVVSKGPTSVAVPSMVGETISAAQLALQTLGLQVQVNTNQLQSNWGIAKVKSMSVSAGSILKRGAIVILNSR